MMRIRDIVNSPDLGTRLFAGASGMDNSVTWAHACELENATEWLTRDELLMTVGYSVPAQTSAQEEYIERLAQAGLSGILIAEGMFAPALSDRAVAAADRLSFPILLNAYGVPYTSVVRAVADANRNTEHARLLKIFSIYEEARVALGRNTGAGLIDQLGTLVRSDLFVVHPNNGRSVLGGVKPLPTRLFQSLQLELRSRTGPFPAILRLDDMEKTAVVVPIPASRSPILIARCAPEKMPHTSVLHHIAAVIGLEVEKLVAEYERRRQLGSELLAGLIDARLATDLAEHLLSQRHLVNEPRRLAACTGDARKNEHADLHLRLEELGVPHLLLRRTPILTALLPDTAESIDAFRREVGSGFSIGLSDPIGTLSRMPGAYREARWALDNAIATDKDLIEYGEKSALSPFLPRTLTDAHRIVEQILGPLIEYDAANRSQLVASLKTFLSNQKSWQRAAADLHVHRQTLVYRMRRVEELTGRKLHETQDVAELWLALRAADYSDT